MTTLPMRKAPRHAEPPTELTARNQPPLTPLELLFEASSLPGSDLPAELRRLYGGELGFDAPCVFANFVQTIDGVVSIPELPRSNALIAAKSEADRFVMGLLRACADAVIVGSGTMLASPSGTWQPESSYPAARESFAELRAVAGDPSDRPSCSSLPVAPSTLPIRPSSSRRSS